MKLLLPAFLERISAVARELTPTLCTSEKPVPVFASPTALRRDAEEVERMLPARPMSLLNRPLAVYTAFVSDAPLNPFSHVPNDDAPGSSSTGYPAPDFKGKGKQVEQSYSSPRSTPALWLPAPTSSRLSEGETRSPDLEDCASESSTSSDSVSWASTSTSPSIHRGRFSLEGRLLYISPTAYFTQRPVDYEWFSNLNPRIASFRPYCTEMSRIMWGHDKGTSADASGTWPRLHRRIAECHGYVMDASERLNTRTSTRLRKQIEPNAHVANFDHTRDRLSYRVLSALSLEIASMPTTSANEDLYYKVSAPTLFATSFEPTPASSSEPTHASEPMHNLTSNLSHSLPELLDAEDVASDSSDGSNISLDEAYHFQDTIYREHAHLHPLPPVTHLLHDDPVLGPLKRFSPGRRATPNTSETEEPAAKRLKVTASTNSADTEPLVDCMDWVREAFGEDYMRISRLREFLSDLRWMRIKVGRLISRILVVLECLGYEHRFLEIFLPDDPAYQADSAREAFELEFLTNYDGSFRRNVYHRNAILHDTESNFLHAANIFFRELGAWPLAYSIKEFLHLEFQYHHDVELLLRHGHLFNHGNYDTHDPETLNDWLAEMEEDYSTTESPPLPEEDDAMGSASTQSA
ncbi:hypothetical protein C8J57DRAFT_1721760 [Mycena rebaudengoi]|nr:hypothetical protein C8J57DRAFT_1721760 [Mycena rebaudengoi]